VGDLASAGPVMPQRRQSSRSPRALGLRKLTVLVPENCADSLRDLARVLRARQRERTANSPFEWRRISPSAELMVDSGCGARCAIRDTRAAGGERYQWTVTVVGELAPVAAGRTGEPAEARSRAEGALLAYAEGGGVLNGSGSID
jgi:hypothetical protein